MSMQNQHAKKSLVLSDMQLNGKDVESFYRQVSLLIDRHQVDRLITVGPDLYSVQKQFRIEVHPYKSTDDLLDDLPC